jgi:hypothetical protein
VRGGLASLNCRGEDVDDLKRRRFDVLDYAGDHVALAADSARDDFFAGSRQARLTVLFIPMPIFGFTADDRLIDLDNAAKLSFRFDQRRANFVTHGIRGAILAEAHHELDLECGLSVFSKTVPAMWDASCRFSLSKKGKVA